MLYVNNEQLCCLLVDILSRLLFVYMHCFQDVYVGRRESADNAKIVSQNIMLNFLRGFLVRNVMDWVLRGLIFMTYPYTGAYES